MQSCDCAVHFHRAPPPNYRHRFPQVGVCLAASLLLNAQTNQCARVPKDRIPKNLCATIIMSLCYRRERFMARVSTRTKAGKTRLRKASRKFHDVLVIAEREGLLRSERTKVLRGRMPEALVSEAKKRT